MSDPQGGPSGGAVIIDDRLALFAASGPPVCERGSVSSAMDGLAAANEVGRLGIRRLKRMWSRWEAEKRGLPSGAYGESHEDHLVLDAIGVGLEQAFTELSTLPSFEAFEDWIEAVTGGVDPDRVARVHAALAEDPRPEAVQRELTRVDEMDPVLHATDLANWEEHGYVVLHDAIDAIDREATVDLICRHLGANLDAPDSWYAPNDHGIMVQLFQHPALDANRRSPRIHKAFAQLWGTSDLWVSVDRVGFNAPERPGHRFPGPDLHWDVSLAPPIPFGTQGLIYLTDTDAEQGALTLVPGFHRRIERWLEELPAGANARQEPLHDLGAIAVPGRAGDCIIWHQALPHGSRPNRSTRPRLVQYINRYPTVVEINAQWR